MSIARICAWRSAFFLSEQLVTVKSMPSMQANGTVKLTALLRMIGIDMLNTSSPPHDVNRFSSTARLRY